MYGHDDSSSSGPPDDAAALDNPDITPRETERQDASESSPEALAREAPPVQALVPIGAQRISPDAMPRPWAAPRSWIAGAIAAALVCAASGALLIELRHSDRLMAENARETESLTEKVKALETRLVESADLRRSVGEMRSSFASARDVNGAVAQLSQRLDKLDRDETAKVDRLGDRVDRDAGARAAELSARIEKLERKVVAQAVPSPPPPAPPFAAPAKAPVPPIKPGAEISMETTGSIQRSRPVLRGYIVLDAEDDVALVGGRYGEREVRPGDFLPGAGRVLRIERQGRGWVVLTNQGLIAADPPSD